MGIRQILFYLFLLPSFLLVSCFQAEDNVILNPDGSGKVTHTITFSPTNTSFGGSQAKDPQKQLEQEVEKVLNDSVGVDAWENVKYSLNKDGKATFTGTAYFSDISKLELKSVGGASGSNFPRYINNKDGTATIKFAEEEEEESSFGPNVNDVASYKQVRAMMAGVMEEMEYTARVKVPGKILKGKNYGKGTEQIAGFDYKGKELLETMDKLMEDEEFVKKLEDGGDFDELSQAAFIDTEGVTVKLSKKSHFNYNEEVVKAQKSYDNWIKTQPFGKVEVVSSKVTKPRIVGFQFVKDEDFPDHLNPLNNQGGGVKLSVLISSVGGKVLDTQRGKLLSMVTDSGESLKDPNDSFAIGTLRESQDGQSLMFDVSGLNPKKKMSGFKEVSGEVEVIMESPTTTVDLQLPNLKQGAVSDVLNAEITLVEPDEYNKKQSNMSIRVNINGSQLQEFIIYDEHGKKLKTRRSGWSGINGVYTFGISLDGEFPEKGKVELVYYEKENKVKIPFSFKDVTLESLMN